MNRSYLHRQILPHFVGRQVAEIDGAEVRRWFASLAATPVAADRSMLVLSIIMREARGWDPVTGQHPRVAAHGMIVGGRGRAVPVSA